MTWTQRMNLALEYIERNLDSEIVVADVAKHACCSKYHFHRMFLACFNVTCAEYIRRRKLTVAAVDLLNTDHSILDIALKYGYDSPNAFTRAFRNVHGINPSTARATAVTLSSYNRVFFPVINEGSDKMNYKIIEMPQFDIIGKSKHFEFDKFVKDGPQFWKEFVGSEQYQALCQINDGRPGLVTASPLLTAYFPQENGQRDEFLDVLGVEATSDMVANGFEIHTVPAATYAEFNCTYKSSMKTNRYIYAEWFAATGHQRDGTKPDIVAYFPIPFRPSSEMRVRWWIPIVRTHR